MNQGVKEYLDGLPEERRQALSAVREVILQHLPAGYEEGIQYGMLSYFIPLSRYPKTYNGQPLGYVSLASQKNYMSLYFMGVYADSELSQWFTEAYRQSGKKLDMGKSCVRFRKIADLPLDVIGEAVGKLSVDQFIQLYERSRK